jgi:hypothetical protein
VARQTKFQKAKRAAYAKQRNNGGGGRKTTATKSRRAKRRSTARKRWIMRVLRGTGKGTLRVLFITAPHATGRGVIRSKQWVLTQVRNRKFDKDYTPEPDEMRPGWRPGPCFVCASCDKRFRTSEGLAGHFQREHAHEKPEAARRTDTTRLINWNTGGKKGKLRVIPGGTVAPGGRRRKTRKQSRKERQAAANQAAMNRMGHKAMAEVEALQHIRMGFQMLAEMPMQYRDDQPYLPISELRELAAGMERILGGVAVDAMAAVRSRMVQAGFPMELANPLSTRGEELAETGVAFTRWFVQLSDELDAQIRAARIVSGNQGPSTASLVS